MFWVSRSIGQVARDGNAGLAGKPASPAIAEAGGLCIDIHPEVPGRWTSRGTNEAERMEPHGARGRISR